MAVWAIGVSSTIALAAPKITIEKWSEAVEETFDASAAPGDLPNALFGKAEADAKPWVDWRGAALLSKWDSATETLGGTDIQEGTNNGETVIRPPGWAL